jgi:hypothetical protein
MARLSRRHDVAMKIQIAHILSPLRTTNNRLQRVSKQGSEVADGEGAVAEQLDFTQESNGCFRLAESETHAEVRTILMGMGYGWLTLANHRKSSSKTHLEPFDEPTDEPTDDVV